MLYAASDTPTMGGSYVTVALNIGAVVGPAIGAATLSGHGDLGPVRVAAALTGVALLAMVASLRLIAPRERHDRGLTPTR